MMVKENQMCAAETAMAAVGVMRLPCFFCLPRSLGLYEQMEKIEGQ